MPSPLQPSINLAKSPGSQLFDDSVAPGPYEAAGDSALVVAILAANANLNLPNIDDGAYLGQLMHVQVVTGSVGTLGVVASTPFVVAAGQVAQIVATDDGSGGIAWVLLALV